MGEETTKDLFMYRIESDGTYNEPIKFDNVTSVTLDEPSTNEKYITRNIPTTFTATLNLSHAKMSKKKFKKWCMSHNISRNEAEILCQLLRLFYGSLSYQEIYMIGIFMPSFESILDIIVYKYKKLMEESEC